MGINTFPAASSSGVNYSAGATGSKPASPATGATFYDTTLDLLQIYDGTSWNPVNNSILAPTWTTAAGSLGGAGAGNIGTFTVLATSIYGLTITYTSSDKPDFLSLNASTGVFTGTMPAYTGTSADTYSFTVSAYDGSNVAQRTFSVTSLQTVTGYLVVAAGGGSGANYDNNANVAVGGGGGGGVIGQSYGFTIGQSMPIVIGAGGAAVTPFGPPNGGYGNKGSNTTFNTSFIAYGGGGGGIYGGSGVNPTYMDGGSGGGRGGGSAGIGGAGVSGQGFAGGGVTGTPGQYGAGGGGGAGSTGGNSTNGTFASGNGGAGGSGGNYNVIGIVGSGGGGSAQVTPGTGGTNAGNGGYGGNGATNGTANKAGGGGGGYDNRNSGAGGSGVVLIQYPVSQGVATSTTGSPTYSTDGTNRYYVFTSSGSITI